MPAVPATPKKKTTNPNQKEADAAHAPKRHTSFLTTHIDKNFEKHFEGKEAVRYKGDINDENSIFDEIIDRQQELHWERGQAASLGRSKVINGFIKQPNTNALLAAMQEYMTNTGDYEGGRSPNGE